MRIKSFKALRPPADLAADVASPPYDVVSTEEARALAKDNPRSFLHVVRPEIDLPEGTNLFADEVYAKAAENFRRFQDDGSLVQDDDEGVFIYRLALGEHQQTGVVAVSHVQDYLDDIIKKHEKTKTHTENDRTRHVESINANAGPIFLTYRDSVAIDSLVDGITQTKPIYDFEAVDGIQHTIWKSPNPEALASAFCQVPCAYIADGHHRAASAARVAVKRRDANPTHTGEEEYNWFLTVFFPAAQLRVLAYNRTVRDLNGMTQDVFLEKLHSRFEVSETSETAPSESGVIHMYLGQRWCRLSWDSEGESDPVKKLDVSVLQDHVLQPLLGIDDPRTNERLSFIGGIRGAKELQRLVDSGVDTVAFSMFPTTVDQLMAIADAGLIMPPKSTWFEPKLRSGLLVHGLD